MLIDPNKINGQPQQMSLINFKRVYKDYSGEW